LIIFNYTGGFGKSSLILNHSIIKGVPTFVTLIFFVRLFVIINFYFTKWIQKGGRASETRLFKGVNLLFLTPLNAIFIKL